MKRSVEPYQWPDGLLPLRAWLARQHVDVDALKSERQALWMAKNLGKQKIAMPKHGASCFPSLLKVQRTLCPNERGGKAPIRREKWTPGTFGAASEVRHIDPSTFKAGGAA